MKLALISAPAPASGLMRSLLRGHIDNNVQRQRQQSVRLGVEKPWRPSHPVEGADMAAADEPCLDVGTGDCFSPPIVNHLIGRDGVSFFGGRFEKPNPPLPTRSRHVLPNVASMSQRAAVGPPPVK